MVTTIEKLLAECDEQYGFSQWPETRLQLFKSLPEATLTKIWLDIPLDEQDLRELRPEQVVALPLIEILPEDMDTKTKMIETYQAALKALGTVEVLTIDEEGSMIYQPAPFTYEEDRTLIEMLEAGKTEREVAVAFHRSVKLIRERIEWLESCSLNTLEELKAHHKKEKEKASEQ